MSQTRVNNVKSVMPNGFMRFSDLKRAENVQTEKLQEQETVELDLDQIESMLGSVSGLLVQAASIVQTTCEMINEIIGDYTEEFGNTEEAAADLDYDLQFLMATPNGTMNMVTVDQCFEHFPWFGESEVLEPIPECKNLYLTCARENLVVSKDKRYVTGPLIVIKVDENNDERSIDASDALKLCRILSARIGMLVNHVTGANVPAFGLEQ